MDLYTFFTWLAALKESIVVRLRELRHDVQAGLIRERSVAYINRVNSSQKRISKSTSNCRLEAVKFEILQVLIHYFERITSALKTKMCGIVSINHPNGVHDETISAMVYSIIKNRPTTNGYNCHELLHEIQIINQGDVQAALEYLDNKGVIYADQGRFRSV